MTSDNERSTKTFIEECLELVGEPTTASAAQLGMAYRAWIGDPDITDDAVVAELVRSAAPGTLTVVRVGGSAWVRGAQLSGIGKDMVGEGWFMAWVEHPETVIEQQR